MNILLLLKKNGFHILRKNLKEEKMGSILKIMVLILISLAHITCISSGPRLMLGSQSSGRLIEFSSYFGKPARLTVDLTECAISKIDGLDLASCLQQKPWLKQQLLRRTVRNIVQIWS